MFILVVRFSLSELLVDPDITIKETKVKKRPTIICIVVLTDDLSKGLHSVLGFEAKADH